MPCRPAGSFSASSSSSCFSLSRAYNRLVALSQRVGQAFADIDVQLKQRHDLIPNLVETVKGYAAHERGTLDDVIKARNAAMSAQGPAQVAAAENQLTGALGRLIALSEAYPDLKANANFQQLAERIVRSREQDRRQPPLLQQRGPGIQHRHPADAGRAVRRHVRLHPQGFLRPRRQPHRGRGGADGEVLSLAMLLVIPERSEANPERNAQEISDSASSQSLLANDGQLAEQRIMAAYGLYTHIASNKFRSMLLLAGLFVLIYVMVFAGALIAEVIDRQRRLGRLLPCGGVARPDRGVSLCHARPRRCGS